MEVAAGDARVDQITVYASGARVRRVTTIPAPLPARVRIVGLPLSVIDDTVRVEVGGPAVATAVRVGVDAPPAANAADEETPEVTAARRRVAIAESEIARLSGALELATAAPIVEPDPTDDPPAAWAAVVAARRALVSLRSEREVALRDQLAAARREATEAQRALDKALDADRRAGTARAARLHELRKHVELDLVATAASEIVIHLEYLVGAARWAPSYVARIDGDAVSLEIRAVVAQDTGEDWTHVPLKLSTAEPERFSMLPELAAQRIGRRQHEPGRAGFRAPPTGGDALYADYERELRPLRREEPKQFGTGSKLEDSTYEGAVPRAPAPPPAFAMPAPGALSDLSREVWDEESSRAKDRFETPPEGIVARGGGAMKKRMASAQREEAKPEPEPVITNVPRLDYGNLVMAPPSSPSRGHLIPAPADRHANAIASELGAAQARIAALALPPGCVTDWIHTYDYAFVTDAAVDVRADGAWHSIPVNAKATTAKVRHVAVPREQPDVFRVATITNPFAAPLLPGPVDVYDRGRFLITSHVAYTPPNATLELGLGVDAAVKLARNTEFREEAAGMLRGALRLVHAITIDVDNLSSRAIELEVRERIPVTREGDDDVEVTLGKVEPAWERWTPDPHAPRDQRLRGGHRWKVSVAAGAKRTLRAAYEVKIASKLEVIGGNRRES